MAVAVDPTIVSATRVACFAECGFKWRMQYVDGITPAHRRGSQLYGTIVHKARERWVKDRKLHMGVLVEEAWDEIAEEDAAVELWLRNYRSLRARAAEFVADIRARRPDIKAPRQTKEWKESAIAAELKDLQQVAMDEHGNESRYVFTQTDSIADLYEESLVQGRAYAERWRHLPNALYTELEFSCDWRGFRIRGHIDSVGYLIDQSNGNWLGYGIDDCKTAVDLGLGQKHLNQLVMYEIGFRALTERGVLDVDPQAPVYVGIDYWRRLEQQWFEVDARQHDRLEAELVTYRETVARRLFLPAARSDSCKRCDLAEECQAYHGPSRAFALEEALGLVVVA